MLFDLQGKRRRVVQATYLGLAILMGGGLVLFGIGGEVSGGGLFDAFTGNGASNGNEIVEERIERNEDRVKANPNSEAARKELVRDYYQLAASETSGDEGSFPPEARDELEAAAQNWTAYLASKPKRPDASLARLALQLYDPVGLNKPKQAQEAARIIAERENSASAYLLLVQYASLAGDKRIIDLASKKAIDLSPKGQREQVTLQLEQIQEAVIAQQLQEQGVDLNAQPGGAGKGTGAPGGAPGGGGGTGGGKP